MPYLSPSSGELYFFLAVFFRFVVLRLAVDFFAVDADDPTPFFAQYAFKPAGRLAVDFGRGGVRLAKISS